MSGWRELRARVHDISLEESAWVASLFGEAREVFDEGLGAFVYTYRIVEGSRREIQLGAVAGHATAPLVWEALVGWGAENQEALAAIYRTGASSLETAARAARRNGRPLRNFDARLEPHGVRDLVSLVGHDGAGVGVFLTALRSARAREPSSLERRALERVARELGMAVRLREHQRRAHSARLTATEHRVAQRLLDGASDKLIASELGVTLSTVSTFTRRLRRKLGCGPGEELLLLLPKSARGNIEGRLRLFDRLTASECDVASELLVGASYAEIADRRNVSIRTVASQCGAIFRKCEVCGRRELASKLLAK